MVYRLNAGGGQLTNSAGTFAADNYFSGGTAYSTSATIAGTPNGPMYQTERYGTFGYALPVSNGSYTVVLHFAELYWTAAGQRVFDVAAEGTKVLTKYDIVKKVGPLTATTEVFPVTVTDGVLNLNFSSLASAGGVDQAKVSAIEVLAGTGNQAPTAYAGTDKLITLPTNSVTLAGSGSDVDGTIAGYSWSQSSGPGTATFSSKSVANPSVSGLVAGSYVFSLVVTDNGGLSSAASTMTVTVNPATTGAVAYRLNAGGGQLTNSIGTFAADNYYTNSYGGTFSSSFSIAGTNNPAMYQTERYGTFGYALPVSNGAYTVVLHFAELYWTAAGQRVFDVAAEGTKVLTKYDIVRKVGPLTATTETFRVTVADNILNLDFSSLASAGGVDQAKVSAIEVLAASTANQAPTAYAGLNQVTTLPTNSVTLAGSGSDVDGTIAGYSWSQSSGPGTATFSSKSVANPSVSGLVAGSYVFSLVVTDNGGLSSAASTMTVTVNPATTGAVAYRLNAGGGQLTNSIGTFAADNYYTNTSGGTFNTSSAIAGTSDPAMYQTERYGWFTYALPVSNGSYTVVLHFAELYWTQPGQRIFDVSIEGTKVLTKYDIVRKVGPLTATTETFPVTINDGVLNLDFTGAGGVDQPKVSAIEVLSATSRPCQGTAAPTVVTPVSYCIGTASALLSSNVTLSSGATLLIYTSTTSTSPIADFKPSTTTASSNTYYVTQTLNGCESARTAIAVNVAPSPSAPTVASPVTYCAGAASALLSSSVTLSSGATLRLYASTSSTTPLADFKPSTATVGSTTYYAAQAVGSCESSRTPLTVTISNGPAKPTVTTPLSYCQGAASNLLSASVTLAAGGTLQVYSVASGGTALAAGFRPPTTTVGSTTYYVSQVVSGCESDRAAIVVNITASPNAPTVAQVTYCVGAASALLSSSVTLSSGATLSIYTSTTSTSPIADFKPSTAAVGSTTYYVTQTLNGCESAQAAIAVNITNGMSAPTVVTPLGYCVGATAALLSSSVTVTSGATPVLYSSTSGGTALAADFRPPTTTIGSTTYYAAQAANGCESNRVAIVVNVAAPANAPTLIPPAGVNASNIAAWGDSFTDANYGLYPQVLSQLTGVTVYNGGVGGESSAQIKKRMVADVQKHSWPSIIWAGRNDSNNPVQVKASIDTMVTALGHSDYLILGICNGSGEGTGTYAYNQIIPLNKDLAAIYGNHFLDVRAFLVAHYDASQSQDVADHAADIPPTSLRQDFLHPNKAGSTLIANYIYANLNQLLNVTYCQGATANLLSTSVRMAAGATLRVYTSQTATTGSNDLRPSTSTIGSTTYYVSQQLNGCESPRTAITVNVKACSGASVSAKTVSSSSIANLATATQQGQTADASGFSVYPNPFSKEATIDFTLPETQAYSLELYDSKGMLVKHIAAGTAQAGAHYSYQVSSGNLREGMYLVRLTTGKASKMFRLTLSK